MTELNQHPLNRASVARLRQANVPLAEILHSHPPTMPVLQLAALGLEENDQEELLVVDGARQNQAATLRQLAAEIDPQELTEGTPEEAAQLVRNVLMPARVSM